jgi:PfaB family protein
MVENMTHDLKQNRFKLKSEMAVIGMTIDFEGCDLDGFERSIYEGQLAGVSSGCRASSQAVVNPTNHQPDYTVYINALQDAHLPFGATVAVLSNLDNLEDSSQLPELSPSVTLHQTIRAKTLLEQLEIAQKLLTETVEIVVLAAVGNESAAIVLTTPAAAQRMQSRIYATIDAACSIQLTPEARSELPKAITQACEQAFAQTGITAAEVGYLELWHSGLLHEETAEINSLLHVYETKGDLTCAVGTVRLNLEQPSPITPLASLIKTVLCLYYRYIPAMPQLASSYVAGWQTSCFYTSARSKPWFITAQSHQRYAAINLLEVDKVGHLILSASQAGSQQSPESTSTPFRSTYLAQLSPYLLPITGSDQSSLLTALHQLRQTIETAAALPDAARQVFTQFQQHHQPVYVAGILGQTQAELLTEIELAYEGITTAFATGKDWKTPAGSYFTANPLGRSGQLAYVYPGAFNSYVGLGQTLFRLFPALHQVAATYVSDIGAVMRERLLYPRSLGSLSRAQVGQLDEQLLADPLAMLGSGMSYATMLTAALRDYFQLRPQAVFGYSLGEISMMCAHAVWSNYDQGIATLNTSSLFQSRLAGSMQAVREYWGLNPSKDSCNDSVNDLQADQASAIWSSYVIRATLPQVIDYVQRYEKVYITHINTANEIVIAGDAQACLRLTKQMKRDLKCDTFRAPAGGALHCEVVRSEYDELVKLNLLPIQPVSGIRFYSAANYQPITLDSQAIAHHIAKGLCQQLDFPRLVNRVYDDGARIFIEVGAGSSCSRWVHDILQTKPHVVISLNKRGVDDHTSIVKALAQLVSHQVSLDLSSLYYPAATQPSSASWAVNANDASKNKTPTKQPSEQHSFLQSNQRGVNMSAPVTHAGSESSLIHLDQGSHLHKLHQLQQQKLSANLSHFSQVHLTFLKSRQESFRQLCQVSELQLQVSRMLISQPPEHDDGKHGLSQEILETMHNL